MPKDGIQRYNTSVLRPFSPNSSEWDTESVAHSLSLLNRFVGHVKHPYSVATHSLLVYQIIEQFHRNEDPVIQAELQLAALIHDASESWFGDSASPIKNHPNMYLFRQAEHNLMLDIFIWHSINVTPSLIDLISNVDRRICCTEATYLFKDGPCSEWKEYFEIYKPYDVSPTFVDYWFNYEHHWIDAKTKWLEMYSKLSDRLTQAKNKRELSL